MSITLPRNFAFHYADGNNNNIPQTPVPAASTNDTDLPQPPVIPRPGFKIRRRKRVDNIDWQQTHPDELAGSSSANVMPTIEMTEASDNSSPVSASNLRSNKAHLAPSPRDATAVSPPRTPTSQGITPHNKLNDEWALINRDLPMRPISACSNSNFSESSISSAASSSQTFPSLGGSCTSPDSEPPDPFIEPGPLAGKTTVVDASSPTLVKKRRKTKASASQWSSELDHHLWLTYMKYVQDPTVTPFKMLPGIVPPLGVCHRVARQAKRTWTSRSKKCIPSPAEGSSRRAAPAIWPGSESATRRRLRDLCRRKPSLSAHYQRLLKARSASPFTSSSSPGRDSSSGPIGPPDLTDRGAADPLVTPVATSAVPKLDAQPTTTAAPGPFDSFPLNASFSPVSNARPAGWFARAGGRSRAHQKSQSLQLELGLGLPAPPPPSAQADNQPVLASPFAFHGDMNATKSLGRSFARSNAVPVLRSPFDLHPAMGSSASSTRPLKRALKVEDDTPDGLRDVFARPNPPTSTPRPVRPIRDRALSLGAVHAGVRDIASSFAHPPPLPPLPTIPADEPMQDAQESQQNNNSLLQTPLRSVRLGSPFGGGPLKSPGSSFNTFPRRFTSRGSVLPRNDQTTPDQQRNDAT